MRKSTNYLKTNHSEYQALIPAMNAYRKALKAFVGADFKYYRVYTEPRAYGARTKFWSISSPYAKIALDAIETFIRQNGCKLVVDGITYEVSAKWNYMRSISLYFKAVSCNETNAHIAQVTELTDFLRNSTPAFNECLNDLERAINEFESTINNKNNNTMNTNPTISAIVHSLLKPGKQSQSLYLGGEMIFGIMGISGVTIAYEGSADLEPNGDICVEVAEWYYDVQKGHPFSGFKYEEMKRAIDAILMATNPQITDIKEFDAAMEKEIAKILKERATAIFCPKPAVVADPTPAFDPQEFFEFVINHRKFNSIIETSAEYVAEEIQNDADSFVDLSMTHNQVEIDIDMHTVESTVTRYFGEGFEENLDGFCEIYTEFMHNKALQACK